MKSLKYWLIICLSTMFLAALILKVTNDCPAAICGNLISREQRRANAHIAYLNTIQSSLLLENKEAISFFEREKCFTQDGSYIFVCQTTNISSAFPTAYNYAISRRSSLKSYIGGVFIMKAVDSKKTAWSLICEAKASGTQLLSQPIDAKTCSSETIRVEEQFIP